MHPIAKELYHQTGVFEAHICRIIPNPILAQELEFVFLLHPPY